MSLQQLGQVVNGRCSGQNVHFSSVNTDSRSVGPGELFVALQGERFDAHDFVEQARLQGAVAALVSRSVDSPIPQVLVDDTLDALSQMAAETRRKAHIPVVAITGSNGKTSVKEMLAAILSVNAPVLATQGNLNNHIGVPLTLLRLTTEHRYAVIEMGANHPGEIAGYCEIAKPTVSLINNIGAAHLEGFGSLDGVAQAKGEIISGLAEGGVAVLNRDDSYFERLRQRAGNRSVISFGFHCDATVRGDADSIRTSLTDEGFVTDFKLCYQAQAESLRLPMPGRHNVSNALAVAAVALALGISIDQIREGLSRVRPVAGRMQVLPGVHGSRVIHDAYNANPRSLQAALQVLSELDDSPWLVLGDFAELGPGSDKVHAQIGKDVYQAGIRMLMATGPSMAHAITAYQHTAQAAGDAQAQALYFASKSDLAEHLEKVLKAGQVVLVKGSRAQHMERVIEAVTHHEGESCS